MSKRYFKKELPDSAVYIGGHPFKFDVLETEDPTMIAQLDACISRQVGGIIAITQEQYAAEAQKKTNGIRYEPNFTPSPNLQRSSELSTLRALRAAEAGVNRAPSAFPLSANDSNVTGRPRPDPISVPSPNQFSGIFLKPVTAKASDVKAAATEAKSK
jgi:hypothetical protein